MGSPRGDRLGGLGYYAPTVVRATEAAEAGYRGARETRASTRRKEGLNVSAGSDNTAANAENIVYDISGGGQFRLADFKRKKAGLIANHIVDDGSVSWHADPFKRLKELQARYGDRRRRAQTDRLCYAECQCSSCLEGRESV